jgi:hypothetical protein
MLPLGAHAETPLSAIDWLAEHSIKGSPKLSSTPNLRENPALSATVSTDIEVTVLRDIQRDAVGLLPPEVTGLPVTLWRNSTTQDLLSLLEASQVSQNPSIQSLTMRVMLAEGDAPYDSNGKFNFLRAKLEKLIQYGAIDPALAMLERAAPLPAPLVPILFDLSMYSEALEPACEQVLQLGAAFENDSARIYCLARRGEWQSANIMLTTAEALQSLTPRETAMLHFFLETGSEKISDLYFSADSVPTPLEYRLYEAFGEPVPANNLPLAFSVAELSGDKGWKAQLEAAERLSKSGVFSDNQLLGLLTKKPAPASGGIWDRVTMIQDLEQALEANAPARISVALRTVWSALGTSALATPIARLFYKRLVAANLLKQDLVLVHEMGLLTDHYQDAAKALITRSRKHRLEVAVALNRFTFFSPRNEFEQAILKAYKTPRIPYSVSNLLAQGKLGEVILNATLQFEKGSDGDLKDLIEALSTLRHIGLDDTARRATLSLIKLGY